MPHVEEGDLVDAVQFHSVRIWSAIRLASRSVVTWAATPSVPAERPRWRALMANRRRPASPGRQGRRMISASGTNNGSVEFQPDRAMKKTVMAAGPVQQQHVCG